MTDVFTQVADLLLGDGGADVVRKNATTSKEERRRKTMQNVAIGTNAVGTVAGPAAIGLAFRSAARNEGGMPRTGATIASGRMKRSRSERVRTAGERIARGVKSFGPTEGAQKFKNLPKRAKVAGGVLVGLQGVNWGGDALSAKIISDQKKKDAGAVKKSGPDKSEICLPGTKGKLISVGAKKVKPHITAGAKKLKSIDTGVSKAFEEFDVVWSGEFSKTDTDKRQVFGWASIVEMNGAPVVDLQGDYIAIDEVEKSAYEYVHKSRKGGDMHLRDGDQPVHKSDMIESLVVTPEKKKALGLPDSAPIGWWVGYQINDDELWGKVKSGERTGFSIHGRGKRAPMED